MKSNAVTCTPPKRPLGPRYLLPGTFGGTPLGRPGRGEIASVLFSAPGDFDNKC